MPRPKSQCALARRAASQERRWPEAVRLRTGVLNAGLATLAVSLLGFGVAASSSATSSAQNTAVPAPAAQVVTTVAPGVEQPAAFQRDTRIVSRSNFRAALTNEQDAEAITEAAGEAVTPAQIDERSVAARASALQRAAAAVAKRDQKLKEKKAKQKAAAKKKAAAAKKALGAPTMPVKSYSIAARFGDVGSWARYHTGFDFSAPIGSPIYAPTAGVVTTAGGGSAGGWAGTYVVVKHADGTQSLYAHMSSVSVQVGERVTGGTRLGYVGQTGRSFGPHLHFEIYPAGVEPGDVYSAVNPQPWLNKLGLTP